MCSVLFLHVSFPKTSHLSLLGNPPKPPLSFFLRGSPRSLLAVFFGFFPQLLTNKHPNLRLPCPTPLSLPGVHSSATWAIPGLGPLTSRALVSYLPIRWLDAFRFLFVFLFLDEPPQEEHSCLCLVMLGETRTTACCFFTAEDFLC